MRNVGIDGLPQISYPVYFDEQVEILRQKQWDAYAHGTGLAPDDPAFVDTRRVDINGAYINDEN